MSQLSQHTLIGVQQTIEEVLVTLYLKPLFIMHYKSIFNTLLLHCNAPYNALYVVS